MRNVGKASQCSPLFRLHFFFFGGLTSVEMLLQPPFLNARVVFSEEPEAKIHSSAPPQQTNVQEITPTGDDPFDVLVREAQTKNEDDDVIVALTQAAVKQTPAAQTPGRLPVARSNVVDPSWKIVKTDSEQSIERLEAKLAAITKTRTQALPQRLQQLPSFETDFDAAFPANHQSGNDIDNEDLPRDDDNAAILGGSRPDKQVEDFLLPSDEEEATREEEKVYSDDRDDEHVGAVSKPEHITVEEDSDWSDSEEEDDDEDEEGQRQAYRMGALRLEDNDDEI